MKGGKLMKLLLMFITLIVAGIAPSVAQNNLGTTAVPFLEIGVGARGVGMGEAQVSSVNDVSALYWNPAAITKLGKSEVSFQHTDWFIDTQLNYAAAVFKMGYSYLGVHFYQFNGGRMQVTDLMFPEGIGEDFTVRDMSLGLSYAQSLTTNFSFGGTVKYIESMIWRTKASTIGLDLGFHYKTPFKNLNLGFAITNFGMEMQMMGDNLANRIDLDPNANGNNDGILSMLATRSWDLPLIFRIGLDYTLLSDRIHNLMLAADAVYPNNNQNYINAGMEYAFRNMVFFRAGYSNAFMADDEGLGHLRMGFGVFISNQIKVDYAFSERGILGNVNMIGASVAF
jgi:long-subunit fatty acid transport protein